MKYLNLTLDVEPCSASRPRVTRAGHAYYAKPYQRFKAAAKAEIIKAMGRVSALRSHMLVTTPMQVEITIVATQPKCTKLPMPKPDVDNYAKAVLDAATGIVWKDDWLVSLLKVSKHWAEPGQKGFIRLEVMDAPT